MREKITELRRYLSAMIKKVKSVRLGIVRISIIVLVIFAQIGWLLALMITFAEKAPWVGTLVTYIAFILAVVIYNRSLVADMRVSWILLLMAFPIAGLFFYVNAGRKNINHGFQSREEVAHHDFIRYEQQNLEVMEHLRAEDERQAGLASYLANYAGSPVWGNTDVRYYDDAKKAMDSQMEALREAKHFIFMEYLTIEDEEFFASVTEVLAKKVKEGVTVRIIYDDVGSVISMNQEFINRMRSYGIEARVFNPVQPFLNIFMNNRDHRKITVVDGKVGFTGGYNIAGKYFHLTEPFGFWKDTGVRLIGDAVQNLTSTFLIMWNSIGVPDREIDRYFSQNYPAHNASGYVQPYCDSPLDGEQVGEEVYMNILKNAVHTCWFSTPYLILSEALEREMISAARRGVDVRIIIPSIPDKKIVYEVTLSTCPNLLAAGVKIYLYKPGFCHAKMCVSDDRVATVGTFNLDFRSLYLHFENGCIPCRCKAIKDITADFRYMFLISEKLEAEDFENMPMYRRSLWRILRLFATLL